MGGGNVVYSLTKTFKPFAEVSYFPGIEDLNHSSASPTPMKPSAFRWSILTPAFT